MKMTTINRIGLSISKIIIEKVDNDRGDIPRSRFIEKILKSYYKIQEPGGNKKRNKKITSSSNHKTAAKQIDLDELTNT